MAQVFRPDPTGFYENHLRDILYHLERMRPFSMDTTEFMHLDLAKSRLRWLMGKNESWLEIYNKVNGTNLPE